MKLQTTIRNKFSVALIATAMLFLMLPLICAAQGKIAFHTSRDGNYEIYKMNPDGTNQVNLTNSPSFDSNPSFNGSGSKIAFVSRRDNGNSEIYSMNADGSNQVNLTNNTGYDTFPSFCPNGSKIAFTSRRAGNDEIYVMNPDGSNQIRLTFEDPAVDFMPTFSPDCSKIAFVSDRDGNDEIYVMNADGTNEIRLTNDTGGDSNPKFSADGTKIVFSSSRGGFAEIYMMDSDGSYQVGVTGTETAGFYPSLSPDGSKVTFVKYDGIYVMNLDGTGEINLTPDEAYEWAPSWGREPGNHFSLLTLSDLLSPDSEPNRATAGNSVPIDFRLGGFRGGSVYNLPPSSQRIDCVNRRPVGTVEPINRTQPDVVYNTALEHYSTTWLTPTAWRGTCRRLVLNLNDGSTRMLDFNFR